MRFPDPFPDPWFVDARDPALLTGRSEMLDALEVSLASRGMVVLVGPAGVGKTALAIRHAFRRRSQYLGGVALLPASTDGTLAAAAALWPRINNGNPFDWLRSNSRALVILDDAGDLTGSAGALLAARGENHVIVTARTPLALPDADEISVGPLDPPNGALLCLKRARAVAITATLDSVPESSLQPARELATLLEGLPSRLMTAGAYCEEAACGVRSYLKLIQSGRITIDGLRSNQAAMDGL